MLEVFPERFNVILVQVSRSPAAARAAHVFRVHEVFQEVRGAFYAANAKRREACGASAELIDEIKVRRKVSCARGEFFKLGLQRCPQERDYKSGRKRGIFAE
ncbi:hypothetical protein GCM10009861_11190 [Neomicrococcus aestuarii]